MEKRLSFPIPIERAKSALKAKGHNTLEWKIDINMKTKQFDTFSIDGYKVQVLCYRYTCDRSDRHFNYTIGLYQFELFFYDSSICPVSYTFSILDREGRAFVTSKGKMLNLKHEESYQRILSVIYRPYLEACDLIENGILTVRFSIHRQIHAQEESHSIKEESPNVADNATSTNPLITKDSSTNTDREDTMLLETLSNDFGTFYENKTDTDCMLRVCDAQFHVHRAILSARSSVFSAMFHHDTAESRSGEVNIQDVKATVLSDVLYYVYSGKVKGLTANTATSMYAAADKYDLPALRTECFEFIKHNLTMDNFCDVALLAHTYGEMELEERVVSFIEENLDEVSESNIWHQFLKDKTLIASKLLMSGFKIAKNKQFRDTTSK